MKRIIALFAAVCILASVLCSCSKKYEIKPSDKRVVMTVGGEKIYYEYFKYVFLNTKADMDGGDESFWNNDPDAFKALKESVMETIIHNRAIMLLADKHGVALTEDELKVIHDSFEELKADKDSWSAAQKEGYMSEYSFLYLERFTNLWDKTYEYVTNIENGIIKADDETVINDASKNFRNVSYVYIPYKDTNRAEKLAIAQTVYDKAVAGEDFDELIKEYGQDNTMAAYIEPGYYYAVGSKVPEFEEAVENIGSGEIAPILDLKTGFFVIKRLNIDLEYVEDNLYRFTDMYLAKAFNNMIADLEKDMEISYGDVWNNLTIDSVK